MLLQRLRMIQSRTRVSQPQHALPHRVVFSQYKSGGLGKLFSSHQTKDSILLYLSMFLGSIFPSLVHLDLEGLSTFLSTH